MVHKIASIFFLNVTLNCRKIKASMHALILGICLKVRFPLFARSSCRNITSLNEKGKCIVSMDMIQGYLIESKDSVKGHYKKLGRAGNV